MDLIHMSNQSVIHGVDRNSDREVPLTDAHVRSECFVEFLELVMILALSKVDRTPKLRDSCKDRAGIFSQRMPRRKPINHNA